MYGTCKCMYHTHTHMRTHNTHTRTHKRGIWQSLHKVEANRSIQSGVRVSGIDWCCHSCSYCSSLSENRG